MMRKAWTIQAIFQAHNGADQMTEQGYTAIRLGYQDCYLVTNPDGMRYRVFPSRPECNCPQCNAQGICKHIVWVQTLLNDMNEEEFHLEQEAAYYEQAMEARLLAEYDRLYREIGI